MPVVNFRTRSCISTKGISSPIFSSTDIPGYQGKFNNTSPKCTPEITNIRQFQGEDRGNEQRDDILQEILNTENDFVKGISPHLLSLPNAHNSQSSANCHNCIPQSLSLPVSNSLAMKDTSFQRDKLYDNLNVPTNFTTPINFTNSNLNMQTQYPSYTNAPIIDGQMSDVLLLALYKGFQTPEFQEYMCSIEKKILFPSQSSPSMPTSSFCLRDTPMQPSQLPSFAKISGGKNEATKCTSRRDHGENNSDIFNQKVIGNFKNVSSPIEENTETKTTNSTPTPFYSGNSINVLKTQTITPRNGDAIQAAEYPLNSNFEHKVSFDELSILSPNDINTSQNYANYSTFNQNLSINRSNNTNQTPNDLAND